MNTYCEEDSKAMGKGDVLMNIRRGLAMNTAKKAELFSTQMGLRLHLLSGSASCVNVHP